MRLGINLSIDVTKLDKSRFYKGKKGTYAKLTCFVDTEETSQYGDNGTITQEVSKEDRENGVKLPILGNAKVFWKDGQSGQQSQVRQPQQNNQNNGYDDVPDSIPF
ncbi:MAG: hypothetical protein WC077_03360 [Bacteroidales bacterium]